MNKSSQRKIAYLPYQSYHLHDAGMWPSRAPSGVTCTGWHQGQKMRRIALLAPQIQKPPVNVKHCVDYTSWQAKQDGRSPVDGK